MPRVPVSEPPRSTTTPYRGEVEDQPYDRVFWLAYLANGLVTLANALMVRYADFVSAVGGEEQQLGLIVGCGMIGSIGIRAIQGEAIDRLGAGRIWIWSILIYVVSLFLHLTITSAYGPTIFAVRLLMQASLAGVFGSSITFVSLRVSPSRMAEVIGTLGTSGFLGIMIGPLIGDWLSEGLAEERSMVPRMFGVAGSIAFLSALATWAACRRDVPPQHRRRPHWWRIVRRYYPVTISITAAAMGAGFSIPMTFLRPFAEETGIRGVGLFFLVYAAIAFVTRIASRSVFERYGNRPWIIVGLGLLSLSFLCYTPATRAWHLILPAALAGMAHALLFPSIVAAGTSAFPRRYLGIATSVTLAMFDVGTFVGAPVVGAFIRVAKTNSWAAYPWMFAGTAGVIFLIAVWFWFDTRLDPSHEPVG